MILKKKKKKEKKEKKTGATHFFSSHRTCCSKEAQRPHSHAGRIPFGRMNPQVCRLLDELQADVTHQVMNVVSVTVLHTDYISCRPRSPLFHLAGQVTAPILPHEPRTVLQMSDNTRRHLMLRKCCIGCRLSPFPHNTTPVSHGITSQTPRTLVRVRVSSCCRVTDQTSAAYTILLIPCQDYCTVTMETM